MRFDAGPDPLIALVYDCVLRDDLLDDLLGEIASRLGAISAVLVYVDPATKGANFTIARGVIADPEVQLRYSRDFAALDPAPAAMSSLRIGQAASTDLIFANTTDRFKPFIEGFLHANGLGGALAGVVANDGGKIGFFAVHRSLDRRIFDESDIRTFEDLLPHVAKMLTLRRSFYKLTAQVDALNHALDATATGIILLNTQGHMTRANIATREILARGDGLFLNRFGALMAFDGKANRAISAAVLNRAHDNTIVVVPRLNATAPYVLRISISPDIVGTRNCTIHIWDPQRATGDNSTLLAQALGLTTSSAKLVTALLDGDTLETYARRAGLSRNTAKFHLSSAFSATRTRRQSELLGLAGALVRDLGEPKVG